MTKNGFSRIQTATVIAATLLMVTVSESVRAQLILNEANAIGVNTDTYIQVDQVYEGWDFGTLIPHSGNTNPPLTGVPRGNPFPADVDSGTVGLQTTLPNGWDGSTGWARIKFNGGDWWELVVTEDHTDLRGWTLYWENDDDTNGMIGEDSDDRSMVRFTNDRSFANLRAGTIMTMSEDSSLDEIRDEYPEGDPNVPTGNSSEVDTGHNYDLSTNAGFDPFDGNDDWNLHYHVDETLTDAGTATPYFEGYSNIKIDNDDWQFAIFDATSNLTFTDVDEIGVGGPGTGTPVARASLDLTTGLVADFVGEEADDWGDATGAGGVNNQEVIALLGDPDNPTEDHPTITSPNAFYEDVDWSTFGSPNLYNPRPGAPEDLSDPGEDDTNINGIQDFSNMRGPVQSNTYDFAAVGTASFTSAGSWELANDNSAAGTAPAATWTARVLNSGGSDVTAVVDANETVAFVEAGATGAGDAIIEIEGGNTLSSTGRALIDDGGAVKIELDGDIDGQGKLEAVGNIDLFSGSSLDFEFVGEPSPGELIKAGVYTILESTSGNVQGTFSSITDLGIYDDDVGVTYNSDSVTLTLDHDLLSGDLNLDGTVNSLDLSILVGNLGAVAGWTSGNINGDSTVNSLDLSLLVGNLGAVISGAGSSLAVPEPATSVMALVCFTLGALGRHWKANRSILGSN